ncbi:hypothetical protein GSI_09204 [Ganoderma sinense ZZ0214-1]|uniref:Transaldolase n=1 Tax=Ganoderma sinense ZZ0214-1 TaxID=1077348 RepID=A0A2G8S5X8_9APHY|nr:hypothetical protein GSI_09204 [Ganoderma sinense ZZ0214-1]
MSKRTTSLQDENAVQSRIPVKSPPRSSPGNGAPPNHNAPSSPTPKRKPSVRFDGKPSIPFPKSSKPAPPVVTTPNGAVDDATSLRVLTAHLPKPPPPLANAKKERPGKVAKGKEKDGKCQAPTYGTVWKTLLHRGKAVVAQTLDRDLLMERRWAYNATWMTPGLLRQGLNEDERAFHAWSAFRRAIREKRVEDWDVGGILSEAMNRYLVSLGVEQLGEVSGVHFTFLDPRNASNARALVRQARELTKLFEAEGYGKGCFVFSIPATEEGAQAARKLEKKYNLRTNLLFVSGLAHAAICAQAGASFVTFPYKTLTKGSVHKIVRSRSSQSCEAPSSTPKRLAEEAIEATAEYFDTHGVATQIVLSVENIAILSEALCFDGFDAVVLDTDQSLEAREPLLAMPPAPKLAAAKRSPASLQARETRYPILESMDGAFMSAMSAEGQNVAELVLQDVLEDWQARMNMVEEHMREWLQHEIESAFMSERDIERKYAQELERLIAACTLGEKLSPQFQIREDDVGFRMTRTLWDRPEAWS